MPRVVYSFSSRICLGASSQVFARISRKTSLSCRTLIFPCPPSMGTQMDTWGFPKLGVPYWGPYYTGIILFQKINQGTLIFSNHHMPSRQHAYMQVLGGFPLGEQPAILKKSALRVYTPCLVSQYAAVGRRDMCVMVWQESSAHLNQCCFRRQWWSPCKGDASNNSMSISLLSLVLQQLSVLSLLA